MARKRHSLGDAEDDPRWTWRQPAAPGQLRAVHAFAKTAEGGEQLSSPAALSDWLVLWGLPTTPADIGQAELERAIEVRQALRTLMAANNGGAKDAAAAAAARLDEIVSRSRFRLRFGAGAMPRFESVEQGFDGALTHFLHVVATNRKGTWRRLKICPGEDCDKVFYDLSRTICTKWCSVRCGNKLSAREYRRRFKRQHGRMPGSVTSRRR